jgi:2-keto-4-pentenoate hydratase/2-oxohepta-3-ene-1,7-dioic acid hydratase in catechol pathway
MHRLRLGNRHPGDTITVSVEGIGEFTDTVVSAS